jgi:hypothetical protein|tara:strand:+ start:307 stop:513 length:207 start_codon:yes stop_codon:yes gene_type:complete
MLVSLDNVASRYGVLPSYALEHGNTIDLMVLDIASKYERWQNSDEYKKNHGKTEKQLLGMLERAKDKG